MTFGRKFYEPLADGDPKPKSEINNDLERVIHFFPPHLKKVTDKLDEISKKSDVILGNLEDGISPKDKIKARKEFVKKSKKINKVFVSTDSEDYLKVILNNFLLNKNFLWVNKKISNCYKCC